MTIGELARRGGVGVETVRFYQRKSLLAQPPRDGGTGSGGIRRYGEADLRRLRFIRSSQQAGFTLQEIGELIALDSGHDRVRARELAQTRIAALDARIEELRTARQALARLADQCAASTEGPCPIIGAFE